MHRQQETRGSGRGGSHGGPMRQHVRTTFAGSMAAALTLYAAGSAVAAESQPPAYPIRPIRLLVSVAPGAGADVMARAAAQMLSDRLGQSVVVDNRPGAGGLIATEVVAHAPPDGYTILSHGDTLLIQAAMKLASFDIMKSLDPVVSTSTQPYILLSYPGLPVSNMKELIAYSMKQIVTYSGGAGIGGSVHLGLQRFALLSGAKLQFVPYKGSAPALTATMSGEINMAAGSAIAATSALRSGKLRLLANLGPARLPTMPDLPTVAEQGFPDFKVTNRYNLFVPAGTPRAIDATINRIVSEGMHAPAMVQRLAADGSQPAESLTPDQLRRVTIKEVAEFEQALKQIDLKTP